MKRAPEYVRSFRWTPGRKICAVVFVLVLIFMGEICRELFTTAVLECHAIPQPSATQQYPGQAIFTARIILRGPLWLLPYPWARIPYGSPRRYWELAMVQHEYWGLLGWNHKIILLTNYIQKDDFFNREDLFFIEGRRWSGGLVQYLPMYEVYCTRTNRLKDAEIDLRLLHDGPPRDGVRLLGNTYQFFPRTQTWTVAPGRKVLIDGPSVQTVATSDEHGIYDISGLVPGTYYVQPFDAGADGHRHISCEFKSLQTGTVRACDVVVP